MPCDLFSDSGSLGRAPFFVCSNGQKNGRAWILTIYTPLALLQMICPRLLLTSISHLQGRTLTLTMTRIALLHAGCLSGHYAPLPEMLSVPTWSLGRGSSTILVLEDHTYVHTYIYISLINPLVTFVSLCGNSAFTFFCTGHRYGGCETYPLPFSSASTHQVVEVAPILFIISCIWAFSELGLLIGGPEHGFACATDRETVHGLDTRSCAYLSSF